MAEDIKIMPTEPISEDTHPFEVVHADPNRKVSHWHNADKRANQSGPISGPEGEMGRQKKEPCYEAVYFVKNPGGLKINEVLYKGRVVVPTCVANYLCYMDREWERSERDLFRNNSIARDYNVGR